jgi:hypothetical protein
MDLGLVCHVNKITLIDLFYVYSLTFGADTRKNVEQFMTVFYRETLQLEAF